MASCFLSQQYRWIWQQSDMAGISLARIFFASSLTMSHLAHPVCTSKAVFSFIYRLYKTKSKYLLSWQIRTQTSHRGKLIYSLHWFTATHVRGFMYGRKLFFLFFYHARIKPPNFLHLQDLVYKMECSVFLLMPKYSSKY